MDAYESLGLRHSEFAQLAGVSRSTLHRLERAMGAAPSDSTLLKVELALGWPKGTAKDITAGAEIPAAAAAHPITFAKPAALDDPSVLEQLPTQIREELLRTGELLGVDVIDLGPGDSGVRMIVVATRDPSGTETDPEALRATLEEWQRKRRGLWSQD